MFSTSKIRSDGNTLCSSSVATNIHNECGHGVWHICCICMHSMPAITIRNKRLRHSILVNKQHTSHSIFRRIYAKIRFGAFNVFAICDLQLIKTIAFHYIIHQFMTMAATQLYIYTINRIYKSFHT